MRKLVQNASSQNAAENGPMATTTTQQLTILFANLKKFPKKQNKLK